MTDKQPDRRAPQDEDLSRRLDSLRSRLDQSASGKPGASRHDASSSNASGMAHAFKLSSEFIAGILVGGAIGFTIDFFFGTTPWGLIVFLMAGFGAAILNVLRASGTVAESSLRRHKDAGLPDEPHDER